MDRATPPDGARPQEPDTTTAALLEEIASLRSQNEEQRRELEHLRGAVPACLRQPSDDPEPAQPSTMHRFMEFPFEVRQMIWGYALPRQILANQDCNTSYLVVTDELHVPPLGHACRESRRFAELKNHAAALPGAEPRRGPKPRWMDRRRHPKPARWTWFSPSTDALVISALGFDAPASGGKSYGANHVLARAAEHIIVEDFGEYDEVSEAVLEVDPRYDEVIDVLLSKLTQWAQKVYARPYSEVAREDCAPARAPVCSLRAVDFSIGEVTTIEPQDCSPQLLRRLFGGATFRAVDLRETDEFLRALGPELSQGVDPEFFFRISGDLGSALTMYTTIADDFFRHLRPVLMKELVSACFEASTKGSSQGHEALPMPFNSVHGVSVPRVLNIDVGSSNILNMDVPWVRELDERLTIRPVHVFVLDKNYSCDMSHYSSSEED